VVHRRIRHGTWGGAKAGDRQNDCRA